jgi:hypothetical protein
MLEAIRLCLRLAPETNNAKPDADHPSPVHVAIGRAGYRLQSRWLRIPDRYGFFTPAPPRAHEFQGRVVANAFPSWFLFMTLMVVLDVVLLATLDVAAAGHNPFLLGGGFLAFLSVPCWVQHCALAQRELHRAQGKPQLTTRQ